MLSAGIVGLPNVGKSTLFNAVTRTHKAPAENYPFCTIDPNVGVVTVPDARLVKLAEISHSHKIVPTATELVLADLASLQRQQDRLQKQVRAGDRAAKIENALAERLLPHLDAGKPAITAALTPEEKTITGNFFLLTSKPTIFACNVGESDLAAIAAVAGGGDPGPETRIRSAKAGINDPGYSAARHVDVVQDYAQHHFGTEAIVISAQIESELVDLGENEAMEYLRGLGIDDSGVNALIRAVYHLLGLRTFLTTGEKETRAWTIHAGDKAPTAAGVIHSDF